MAGIFFPDPSVLHSLVRHDPGSAIHIIPNSLFQRLAGHIRSDGRRAFTQREMVRVLTAGRESGNLTTYLQNNPLINSEIVLGEAFKFRMPGTQFQAHGYEATTLVDICDSYIEANIQGLLKRNQLPLARQADL